MLKLLSKDRRVTKVSFKPQLYYSIYQFSAVDSYNTNYENDPEKDKVEQGFGSGSDL